MSFFYGIHSCARFRLADHLAPEGLVAEEGDDHGRSAALEADGRRACVPVVHYGAHTREEPAVGRVL